MNLYHTTRGQDSILSAPVDDSGNLKEEGRIKDVAAARSFWVKIKNDDDKAARDRSMVHAMVNGAAPYSRAVMAKTGRKDECNTNWGIAFDLFEEAKAPYVDMTQSVQMLVRTPLKNGPIELDQQQKCDIERIIAEEFTVMVRGWEDFIPRFQFLANQYILDGLLTGHFTDTICWKPQFVGLDCWKMPRRTRASVNEIEACCIYVECPVHELYAKVRHRDAAKSRGWNCDLTMDAIKAASPKDSIDSTQPERFEEMLKANDIAVSESSSSVKLVYLFVRELNGKISHYAFTEESVPSQNDDDFLFSAVGKYSRMSEAFSPFSDGVGTNGFYHSIRGYMHRLFSIIMNVNRLRCSFYDLAKFESTPRLAAESEDQLNERAIIPWGPFMVFMGTMKEAERQPIDFQKTLIPALEDVSSLLTSASRRHSPRMQEDVDPKMAAIEALSKISINAQNLFYACWTPLLREMLRRACSPDYLETDDGWEEVKAFREALVDRGVDPIILSQIDYRKVEAVRAIGNGSAVARKLIYGELSALKWEMDEEGRNYFNREASMDLAGFQRADHYFPREQGMRPPQDYTNAETENVLMRLGQPPAAFRPNDNHVVHIESHVSMMNQIIEELPNANQQEQWTSLVKTLVTAHEHSIKDHMAALPPNSEDAPRLKKELTRLGEIVYNTTKHLQQLEADSARQAEEEQQQAQAAGGGAPDTAGIQTPGGSVPDTLFRQIVTSQTLNEKLAGQRAKDLQSLDHAERKFKQEMAFDEERKRRKIQEEAPIFP